MVTMKIIIASIGGTVGAFIIITCGFLFYRWNRNRNEQPGFINGEQHNLPGRRLAHSTALVENKLYFFGGCVDITKSCTNQVFYLDLSQSFNLAAPPWVSLTQKAGIPFKNELLSSLYFMYLNSLSWHAPVVEGTSPERRRNIRGIIYNTGNIYILGGFVDKALARKPYHSYTTTLLSNGVISHIWSMNQKIQDRFGHTAVLTPDGKILIYGGTKGLDLMQVAPNLIVLNTETEKFEFMVPPVNGQLPPSLTAHTADIFGNYMILAFDSPLLLENSNIYIMDIRNYTWVNSFEVASANITTNSGSSKTQSSPISSIIVANNEMVTMKIIIASIGGTVGSFIIITCGFLFYRWNKNKKRNEQYPNEEHNLSGNIVEHKSSTYIKSLSQSIDKFSTEKKYIFIFKINISSL
ncbi:1448_t:CDS:2 [Funneliformis geosporum]|nr:1448_t:CDS:2 [Funneliformis geosporum]